MKGKDAGVTGARMNGDAGVIGARMQGAGMCRSRGERAAAQVSACWHTQMAASAQREAASKQQEAPS